MTKLPSARFPAPPDPPGPPDAAAPDDVTTLRFHRAGPVDPARLRARLEEASWLGQPIEDPQLPPAVRRYLTDLALPLPPDGRLVSLRKAAFLDLGPVTDLGEDGWSMPIAWRSASLAPLFPVFAGRLEVGPSGMSLDGHYAPPGGILGRAADRVLLHVAARGTAKWLLGQLATAARS